MRFTFDSENYVNWSIRKPDGTLIWSSENEGAEKRAAEWELELAPEESHDFVLNSTFEGKVPETGGKFEVHGTLSFTLYSIET